MAASNWNQSPAAIILDLVAAANSGFDAVRANFTFKDAAGDGNYVSGSVPEGSTKNSSAVLTPTEDGGATYEGDVQIAWNRLTVADYVNGITSNLTFAYTPDGTASKPYLTTGMSNDAIVFVLRNVLGIQLTPNGEFDETLYNLHEVTAGTEYQITLSPKSGTAFLFQGQTETITITQPAQKQQTSSVVSNTELDGLDAPTSGSAS